MSVPAFGTMGSTKHRPVCTFQELLPSSVLFPLSGPSSLGDGRNDPGLVQPRYVHFSSVQDDSGSNKKVPPTPQCKDDSSGPLLTAEGVVPGPDRSRCRLPETPSPDSKSSQTTPCQEVPSRPILSGPKRILTVVRLVRAKGFSRSAAKAISKCRRQSPNNIYQAKWARFRSWCRRNKGLDISSNQDSADLIKSFNVFKSKKEESFSWSLDVVLKWLSDPHFEPMHTSSLRDLTRKALFLVALAKAKREVSFKQ